MFFLSYLYLLDKYSIYRSLLTNFLCALPFSLRLSYTQAAGAHTDVSKYLFFCKIVRCKIIINLVLPAWALHTRAFHLQKSFIIKPFAFWIIWKHFIVIKCCNQLGSYKINLILNVLYQDSGFIPVVNPNCSERYQLY